MVEDAGHRLSSDLGDDLRTRKRTRSRAIADFGICAARSYVAVLDRLLCVDAIGIPPAELHELGADQFEPSMIVLETLIADAPTGPERIGSGKGISDGAV